MNTIIKHSFLLGTLLSLVCCCGKQQTETLAPALSGNQIRIASYNLLFEKTLPSEESQRWSKRIKVVTSTLDNYNVDIVGSQEACTWQVNMILKQGKFNRLGVDLSGKTDVPKNENEALFYRPDRFDVLDDGQFWYSKTPDTPGSYSWDATYARACTWGKFKERSSGVTFYVFNSHFHNEFPQAQLEEAKLLISKVQEINSEGLPMFCTGDFNCVPSSPAIQYILSSGIVKDSHDVAAVKSGGELTYHGFNKSYDYGWRLDYVFVNSNVTVNAYRVLDEERTTGKWGSDHSPVIVDATL